MPRKPRVHFPGAVYHIVARGNNQEKIFANEQDKQFYLRKVKFYRDRYCFELLLFAIMDNHAHMVIKVGQVPLSRIMQSVQQSYAWYHNRLYERCGHVFETRYKAFLCEDDSYLLTLLRYIHRNPLEAGLAAGLDYAWSSHGYYAGSKKDSLVDTGLIYGLLSRYSPENSPGAYNRFMEQVSKPGEIKKVKGLIYGEREDLSPEKEAAELIERIAINYRLDKEQLLKKTKDYRTASARKELIRRLFADLGWPPAKIAHFLNLNPSYIYRTMR
jgi:putative transposase